MFSCFSGPPRSVPFWRCSNNSYISIHAALDTNQLQRCNKTSVGESTPLIRVEDFRRAVTPSGNTTDCEKTMVIVASLRYFKELQLAINTQSPPLIICLSFLEFKPQTQCTYRKKSISTSRRPILFIGSSSEQGLFSALRSA